MFITKDNAFAVVPTRYSHRITFEIYEVIGVAVDSTTKEEFTLYGSDFSQSKTVDDLKPHMAGHVKWDGCSDWNFSPTNCMVHFCGNDGVDSLANMIKECVQYTSDNLDTWFG